jgi:hypothetical protein
VFGLVVPHRFVYFEIAYKTPIGSTGSAELLNLF